MNSTFRKISIVLVASFMLSACGSMGLDKVLPDKQVEYKREKITDTHLEVPPDLTATRIDNQIPGLDTPTAVSTSYKDYESRTESKPAGVQAGAISGVLPEIKGITMNRIEDERWLVIDAPADVVWPRVINFWQENGLLLNEQNAATGVMQTSWLENVGDISSGPISDVIRGAFPGLYDAGTRDKYRVRLERVDEKTELYLTHFGMEQKIVTNQAGDSEQFVWNYRPRDPQLEAEMLRRLMIYFGMAEAQAEALVKADDSVRATRSEILKSGGQVGLVISESFPSAWRLTGLALDRVGFAVEDRDRSVGVYYVRYSDPSEGESEGGWLSSLAFWKGDKNVDKVNRYLVQLTPKENRTLVTVNNDKGERDNSATAERILTLIQEQIK